MAVAIDLSTAGIRVGYAFEASSGTKPSSFTNLPNPKSIPDMNPEPNALDITSLNDTEWKRYMEGLKDMGGALGLTFGMSQEFFTLWENICDTDDTNKADARVVSKACVEALKGLRYSVTSLPIYQKDNNIHRFVLRARRVIANGDTF